MSLQVSRRALVACRRPLTGTLPLRICASSSSHAHEEHHSPSEDASQYSKEGFGSPFWRNAILLSIVGVAVYKYAPEPSSDAYLTRWINLYCRPASYWLDINARNTAQREEITMANLILSEGKTSKIHRFRDVHALESKSPFNNGVGMNVDISDLVVRVE
ncbi:hypothetical protein BDQ17DRAFT_1422622 [Cyathus striatus]|nr:hypothetical protein BDQ17DRAFT_1422622 [Cyathus striatus]